MTRYKRNLTLAIVFIFFICVLIYVIIGNATIIETTSNKVNKVDGRYNYILDEIKIK